MLDLYSIIIYKCHILNETSTLWKLCVHCVENGDCTRRLCSFFACLSPELLMYMDGI
jgi:hypothetical protein